MTINLPYQWKPRQYQIPLWRYMLQEKEKLRAAVAWHRRAGKDITAINIAAVKAMHRVGTYWHMLPYFKQAREIVWDGLTDDGRKFTDHFDPQMIRKVHNTEMKIEFVNGSIYRLMGADDIDRLVGPNPVGIIMSEYSVHASYKTVWDYLTPMLLNNRGWAMFLYTVRSRNHAWTLLNTSISADNWYGEILVAGDHGTKHDDGTPVMSTADIEEAIRDGMSPERADQEFYNDPDASGEGAFYKHEMRKARDEGRITRIPIDQILPVHTSWDIGRDTTAIWFFQTTEREHRMVDYYSNSGEGFPHYKGVLESKGYRYGKHFGPWDLAVKEWMQKNKTRQDLARQSGINFRLVKRHTLEDRIENVRSVLPVTIFDELKCKLGIDCMRAYHKEKNKKTGDWQKEPVHDWASHGADAFGNFAMAGKRGINTAMTDYYKTGAPLIKSTWR